MSWTIHDIEVISSTTLLMHITGDELIPGRMNGEAYEHPKKHSQLIVQSGLIEVQLDPTGEAVMTTLTIHDFNHPNHFTIPVKIWQQTIEKIRAIAIAPRGRLFP